MGQRGFSIIELIVVIAIVGILATLATLAFTEMTRKQAVEDEIKMIYADLASARADSMYQGRQRRLELTGTSFSIYSTLVSGGGVLPMSTKTLRYPIKSGTASTVTIDFDPGGLLKGVNSASICVNPPSDYGAAVDSIVVFTTRTTYGSWNNSSGDCTRANDYIILK
jgi:prepilin-type N-terminal cleavage/methylation domain-containing protein